jgi:hypothetical protein
VDPKDLLKDPEQIKNLISILESLLPKENEDTKATKSSKTKKVTKKQPDNSNQDQFFLNEKIKTKNKRPIKGPSFNKFEQMSEFRMHKDDYELDKKLAKHPPVARTREFDPVSVVCRICGKKEIVSPSLVYEGPSRYKCNNCSTQAG